MLETEQLENNDVDNVSEDEKKSDLTINDTVDDITLLRSYLNKLYLELDNKIDDICERVESFCFKKTTELEDFVKGSIASINSRTLVIEIEIESLKKISKEEKEEKGVKLGKITAMKDDLETKQNESI